MKTPSSETALVLFVKKYLVTEGVPCGRHCNQPVRFASLFENGESIAGVYVCPQGYVSRAVYFATNPDPSWFEDFLSGQAGRGRVKKHDIRFATRHGWELERGAEDEIRSLAPEGIKQYYWTMYPRTEEEKKRGTFLCSQENGGCGKIFTRSLEERKTLCPECSAKLR